MPSSPEKLAPGPLERTAAELRRIHCAAVFGRTRVDRSRVLLRESDALLDLVEECRCRGCVVLPAAVHFSVVRFIGRVDRGLRDELGINRHPARVADLLFEAQEVLLERASEDRRPALAQIIPLFPNGSAAGRRTG